MVKVKDIIAEIEKIAPPELAEEWDNSGLQLGDVEKDVRKLLVTVDITKDVVETAAEEGCDMILSHHPLIFRPIKNIAAGEVLSDKIISLIKNDIAVYSAHTSYDSAVGGVSDGLSLALEVFDVEPLGKMGRVGFIREEMTAEEFCGVVKETLRGDYTCLYGDKNRFVDEENRKFRLDDIKKMLEERGVGLYDTAKVVRRTRNTAADKDLEVVREVDILKLIDSAPECVAVVTTGQKATDIFCRNYGIAQPKVGNYVPFCHGERQLRLYRMPSSSRAYPMRLEKKAEAYQIIFDQLINKKHNNT